MLITRNKGRYKIIAAILLLLFSLACTNNTETNYSEVELLEIVKKYHSLDSEKNSVEFYENLREESGPYQTPIIQAYLTAKIASAYIFNGETEKANSYLQELDYAIERIPGHNTSKFLLYGEIGVKLLVRNLSNIARKYLNKSVSYAHLSEKINSDNGFYKTRLSSFAYLATEAALTFHKYDEAKMFSDIALQAASEIEVYNGYTQFQIDDVTYSALYGLFKSDAYINNPDTTQLQSYINSTKIIIDKHKANKMLDPTAYYEMEATLYSLTGNNEKYLEFSDAAYKLSKEAFFQTNNEHTRYNYYDSSLKLIEALLINQQVSDAKNLINEIDNFEEFPDLSVNEMLYKKAKVKGKYYLAVGDIKKSLKEYQKIDAIHTNMIIDVNSNNFDSTFSRISQLDAKNSILNLENEVKQRDLFTMGLSIFLLTSLLFGFFYYRTIQQKRIAELEKSQLQSDLLNQKVLLSQMEPHFIFNSLSNLRSLINLDMKQDALCYLSNFSVLLRNVIEQSREEFIPLYTEIETISSYIALQKFKLSNPFTFKLDIAKDINESKTLIPSMLIQPFIENAIIHGIKPLSDRNGEITLKIRKGEQKGTLSINIVDNGVGLNKISKNDKYKSYATEIATERLAILQKVMKKETNFLIENNSEEGVTVILKLPVKEIK